MANIPIPQVNWGALATIGTIPHRMRMRGLRDDFSSGKFVGPNGEINYPGMLQALGSADPVLGAKLAVNKANSDALMGLRWFGSMPEGAKARAYYSGQFPGSQPSQQPSYEAPEAPAQQTVAPVAPTDEVPMSEAQPTSPYAGMTEEEMKAIAPAGTYERVKARAAEEGKKDPAAKIRLGDTLESITNSYLNLARRGGTVQPGQGMKTNIGARIGASAPGQMIGGAIGTVEQQYRDSINQARPALINYIRQATGMSARAMDSNVELQFYLQQATDPTKGLFANLKAIDLLDKSYGPGNILDRMVQNGSIPNEVVQQVRSGVAPSTPLIPQQENTSEMVNAPVGPVEQQVQDARRLLESGKYSPAQVLEMMRQDGVPPDVMRSFFTEWASQRGLNR